MDRFGRRTTLAAMLAALAALSACTSSGHSGHSPGPTPPLTSPAGPLPKANPANPLTGGKYSQNPVVAVKIEDTAAGRPQLGIDQADIVYIEQVEGGYTRLVAVYNSSLPTVEPVRSTRASDPELALQFGPIDYVASGGSKPELAPLDQSRLRSDINDRGGPGFSRDSSRAAPNNLRANLAAIAAKLKGPKAKDIGLVWSARFLAAKSRPGTSVRTTVGGTPVGFDWNPKLHRYVRIIDGAVQHTADGKLISTPNVIVQFCRSTVYTKDRDVLGNPSQYTHTVGTGKIAVFRNGRMITGTWSRPAVTDGTTLRGADGKPIALSPGGAWFVLVATGATLG